MEIDGGPHRVDGPFIGKVEVRHLPKSVDAGIRPACARDSDALPAEGQHRVFESTLHGGAILLALPADEWRAVILDRELVARHGIKLAREPRRAAPAPCLMRA